VCQPPCWEGITPGVTTMTETVKILEGLPWVEIKFGPEKPLPNKGDITLEWDFTRPSSRGGVAYAFDNGVIKKLLFSVLSTQLQNVIESHGFPSDVFIDGCSHGSCSTRLIYMTTGMVIKLYLDWDRDAEGDVKVSPENEIITIEFFAPGEQGFLAAYPQYSESFPKWSYPWGGYTKYSFRK
jgi:hypothetical protein